MDDLFRFQRFRADEDAVLVEKCYKAAVDKLQTLYPGKRITSYGLTTIGIESDSLYATTGQDSYELGLVDEETPALMRTRDESIITFRI